MPPRRSCVAACVGLSLRTPLRWVKWGNIALHTPRQKETCKTTVSMPTTQSLDHKGVHCPPQGRNRMRPHVAHAHDIVGLPPFWHPRCGLVPCLHGRLQLVCCYLHTSLQSEVCQTNTGPGSFRVICKRLTESLMFWGGRTVQDGHLLLLADHHPAHLLAIKLSQTKVVPDFFLSPADLFTRLYLSILVLCT